MNTPADLVKLADRLNTALGNHSDKDWNYSRIRLQICDLEISSSPYALWIDWLDLKTAEGKSDLKTIQGELKWGERHTAELGILEIVSLRLNKALIESTSDASWEFRRPVLRVVPRQELLDQAIRTAFWYQVTEVSGDEFDNR